jgi:hypothetical protein
MLPTDPLPQRKAAIMFDESEEPRNDLERQLVQAHEGSIPADALMRGLLLSQVFIPVRDTIGIGGFQNSQRAAPLSLEAEDGTQVLILFTSPERAKSFLKDFPGYEGGILETLTWVLQKMGAGYGIAINPDWAFGLDLDPDMVQQLAQSVAGEPGE